jgi:hypothetical protein
VGYERAVRNGAVDETAAQGIASENAFSYEPHLIGQEIEREEGIGILELSLLELVDLAASIRRDGLTNPVTVAQTGDHYQLETGERRWLAYHLLHWFFEDERDKWAKIPARIVEHVDVWRQATENTARANLNAIGRARQFAILLMDLLAQSGAEFRPFEAFEQEQDFYAQVADGDVWRVPRGKGELLLNAMGLKHVGQLRHYRALLRLPNEVWREADDTNLTEGEIRYSDADTVTPVTVQDIPSESSPSPTPSESGVDDDLFSPEIPRNFKKMFALGLKAGQGDRRVGKKLLSQIEEHRRWLDDFERAVREAIEESS